MKNKKSGQITLIVLLIMVTLLTISLSLISYSVTDIKISQDEKEAMRAFSAAEAGIEEALRQSDLGNWTPTTNLDVGGVIPNISVTPRSDDIVLELAEGEFMNIDLNGAENGTELEVGWTGSAALEIAIYRDGSLPLRLAVEPLTGANCSDISGFTAVNNMVVLPAIDSSVDRLIRMRALCNNTALNVRIVSGSLPVQEYIIESKAAAGSTEESKVSAVEVSKTVSALPPIFDYVLFTQGNIEY